MTDMRIFESDDQRAELGQRQPERHLPLEHAAFMRLAGFAGSLAGDDKHHAHAVRLCTPQEAQQGSMRLHLGEAVQVKPRIDRLAAARDPLPEPSPEGRKRRRLFLRPGFVGSSRARTRWR
jgi:hypothetical protein